MKKFQKIPKRKQKTKNLTYSHTQGTSLKKGMFGEKII